MPEYLAPGVFVEEIDSGSKPIEGVGTNTAAFIGYAKSGDFNKPTFITNWTQFCEQFGQEENALTEALCRELTMTVSEVRTAKKASRKSWNEFVQTTIQRAIATKTANVKSYPEFLRKYNVPQGGLPYMDGSYLAHSVRGFYDNGGGRAYIIRVARPDDLTALEFQVKDGGHGRPAAHAQIAAGSLLIKAAAPGVEGNNTKVDIKHVGENGFSLDITQGDKKELFGQDKDKPLTLDNVVSALKTSKLVEVEVQKTATATATRPEAKLFTMTGGLDATEMTSKRAADAAPKSPLQNGLANLVPNDFIGDEAQRTGMGGMVPLEDINMICAPDLMAGVFQREDVPGLPEGALGPEVLVLTDERRQAILDMQCGLVAHCERMADRMAILDPLPGLTPQEMNATTLSTAYNCDHGQGAIYYPWIKIADPMHKGQQMLCPPSGHIAGVYARVGVERGVHKAPANEALMGAVALETDITKGEQELLNPNGINCIRAFPGMGIRVWGARTLATIGNPSWKYVNVRRLFNYLESTLARSMQWVVFEPNDDDLWGRVRRNISAFLFTEWKEGKLFGTTPGEAYYVKCDAETNPQEMIDLGRLYVEIGVNPVKPAEFVIIRMGQWSGGGSTSEA